MPANHYRDRRVRPRVDSIDRTERIDESTDSSERERPITK